MENSAANQLPEVDSLPDGFVESSAEPLTPRTPTFEQENPLAGYKDGTLLKLDCSNDFRHEMSSSSSDSSTVNAIRLSDGRTEKAEKLRTFPVPLSEKDSFDGYGDSVEMANQGCVMLRECASLMPESADSVSEASAKVSGCDELPMGLSSGQQHVQAVPFAAIEGCPELQTTNLKERSSSESTESLKIKKLVKSRDRRGMTLVTIGMRREKQETTVEKGELKRGRRDGWNANNKGVMIGGKLNTHFEGCHISTLMKARITGSEIGWQRGGAYKETSEVKRKNAKRSLKSEKEFLEFSLKYQQVLAERDAAIALRDKLESLCRELQRQNKILMDECKRVSTEGQDIRLDLSTRFHDAIKGVSNKLEEQKDECLSQLKENEMLRNKLKHLADQYSISEQQFTQKLKQKTLELQLAELKNQQHEEKLVHEQSQMKLYAEQVSQLLATEKNLRLQLTADGEKFQQFQDALLKSNDVFETFKQEIEKMAKSMKELKKENIFLKGKSEKSDLTLIELVEERVHMKKQLEKMKNRKEKLESLCRSLQAERKQSSIGSNISDSAPVGSKTGSTGENS
ncbi:hypothetical protein HHK36_011144 [Tetracentron sinense]|uniref:Alpha-taxilin n=1 Tax=Tetracentron sinense TaxID=13715 RepID=A0A834ZBX8_TETSI|nr:hypothetical protein HHK36_011144 [Tetracentron sinense]